VKKVPGKEREFESEERAHASVENTRGEVTATRVLNRG